MRVELSYRPGENGLPEVWYEWACAEGGPIGDVECNERGTICVVEAQ